MSYDYDENNYWILDDTMLEMDILCQNKTAGSEVYEQATTLMLDLTTHFNMNITYHVTLHFNVYKLSISYTGSKDSVIDVQADATVNTELFILARAIKKKVNQFFEKGYSFSGLLYGTPLCWLDMSNILFKPNYGDYFIWGAFTPGYDPSLCSTGNKNPYGPWTELLLHPDEFLKQIWKNISDSIMNAGGLFDSYSWEEEDDETDFV